jgi:hypothetical protein
MFSKLGPSGTGCTNVFAETERRDKRKSIKILFLLRIISPIIKIT